MECGVVTRAWRMTTSIPSRRRVSLPRFMTISARGATRHSFQVLSSDISAEPLFCNPLSWPRKYSSQTSVDFGRRVETSSIESAPLFGDLGGTHDLLWATQIY